MNNNVDKIEIGKRIKALRASMGMTLEQFGEIFNPIASKSIVSRWESGKSIPSSTRLKVISEKFDVSTMFLLYGEKTFLDYPDSTAEDLFSNYSINKDKINKLQKASNIKVINNFFEETNIRELNDKTLSALAALIEVSSNKDSTYKDSFLNSVWSLSVNFDILLNNNEVNFDYKKNIFDTIMTTNYMIVYQLILANSQFNKLTDSEKITNLPLRDSNSLSKEENQLMKQYLANLPMGDISDNY